MTARRYYAGVGSRETPEDVLVLMRSAARVLAQRGFVLRTGGADGADRAFFSGANDAGGDINLFLPWKRFWAPPTVSGYLRVLDEPTKDAYALAAQFHPSWPTLKHASRALVARNGHQVLGSLLLVKSAFVLCWTPGASGDGGTGQAIRIAHHHHIPVFDLAEPRARGRIEAMCEGVSAH